MIHGRETRCTGQTQTMTSYFCKCSPSVREGGREGAGGGSGRRDEGSASYHLGFFLFLLDGSEETLFLLFFGGLRGVQHHRVRAGPFWGNQKERETSPQSNEQVGFFFSLSIR